MPIPKYNEMYREFLQCLEDGQPHSLGEIKESLAQCFSLSEEEKTRLYPSGKKAIFPNRVEWTKAHLKKMGLLQNSSRGICVLTSSGKQAIAEEPNKSSFSQFQPYEDFDVKSHGVEDENQNTAMPDQTPQDMLDEAVQKLNQALYDDILEEIMKQPPDFFERLVVKLLMQMGYGGSVENAGVVMGRSGDEGIDGLVQEDKLGFGMIYIQAKRWDCDTAIGRPEVQKFVGALAGQGASKGLFITTAKFTAAAREYVKIQHTTKVVLVDGQALARLMVEYDLGVSTQVVYKVKRLDSDFFSGELD